MALANYTDLLSSIAGWLDRTDLTSVIPDFVKVAESRIAGDLRIRRQVVNTTLSTVAGSQAVALPTDFLELENLTLSSTMPPGAMSVVTPEIMDRRYPKGYQTGQPLVYTFVGNDMLLGPTPDGVYSLSLDYHQRLNLASTATNWLMTNYPMVYLASSMVEASMYVRDAEGVQLWDARYQAEVKRVEDSDDAAQRSGSIMRVRAL